MPIDLSKLKALELPSKEIEVEILGEVQKVKITAMGDDMSLDIKDIQDSTPIHEVKVRKLFLTRCAGATDEQADILCQRAGNAVARIINAVLDLTSEFDAARDQLRKEAKKKFKPESSEGTRK
jgi:hypothetical protein